MSEKRQEINTWLTMLENPAASKGAIVFKAPAVSGQKAIIKNGTDKHMYFRGDSDATTALAAFPSVNGSTPVEGVHIPPGQTDRLELVAGMTQLSCFPYGGAAATGIVSVKVGNGS